MLVLTRSDVEALLDADELVDAVVVGLDVVVGDRPVVAEAVEGAAPEVIGPEAQGDSSPMIGPTAVHPGAKPVELVAGCGGVGLAVECPSAEAGIELTELPFWNGRSPAWRLV
jgi:hypothetical protein